MNMRCDQALLGAVLSDPGEAHAVDLVRSSDFGCPWHAQLFEAIQRLRASGAAPGPHQVRAELPDDPDIPGHVHDQAWLLTGLGRGCPHSGHAVAYAGLVRGVGVRLARVAKQGSFGNVLSLAGRARADLETARQRWDPLPTAVRREIPTPSLDPGDLAAIANQAAEIRNQMGRLHAGLRAGNQTGLAGWAAIATQQLADISAAQADHMQPAAGQARPAGPEAIGAGEQCLRDLAASLGVIAEIRSWLRPAHFATAEQAELYTRHPRPARGR
jgi:DnaB-like helicase N terminal domain